MANDSHKADDFKLGSSTITQKDPYVAELEAKLQKIHQQQIDAGRASALKTKGTYKPFRQYINRRCELFEGDTPTNRKEWVVLWKEIINDLALKSVNDFIEVIVVSPYAIRYRGSKEEFIHLKNKDGEFDEEYLHWELIEYYELDNYLDNYKDKKVKHKTISLHPIWRYMKEYFKEKIN